MSGRHRKQSNHNSGKFVAIATTGSFAAIGGLAAPGIASAHDWSNVAQCESSGNWANADTGGTGHYGGLQFSQSSWEMVGGLEFAPRADLATMDQQIIAAERLLAVQGEGAWECITAYGAQIGYGGITPGSLLGIPGAEAPPAAPEPAPAPPVAETTLSGWEWPVDGPMSQGFSDSHDGIDLAVDIGTPLHAPTSGTITGGGIGADPGGYGNYIEMVSDQGEVTIQMGHLSDIYVGIGDHVDVGQIIGATGNTGSSTGPHLHLRIHTGRGAVDPAAFLNSSGAANTGEHLNPPVPEAPAPAPVPEAPAPPVVDPSAQDHVVVVEGDTLSGIAAEHGLSWQDVWGMNPQIEDPDLIFPDQNVVVG